MRTAFICPPIDCGFIGRPTGHTTIKGSGWSDDGGHSSIDSRRRFARHKHDRPGRVAKQVFRSVWREKPCEWPLTAIGDRNQANIILFGGAARNLPERFVTTDDFRMYVTTINPKRSGQRMQVLHSGDPVSPRRHPFGAQRVPSDHMLRYQRYDMQ